MTLYNGNLLDAIDSYLAGSTTRKFGLLVIDEQGNDRPAGDLVNAMLETVSFADARGFLIVTVEINPPMTAPARVLTRAAFRAHMTNPVVFYKTGFNAFGVIDGTGAGKYAATSYSSSLLDGVLRNAGVNELIVLGRMAEQCVRLTVTGGKERPHGTDPDIPGALGYGYQVWTSPKIIEGDSTGWTGQRGIKCYSLVA
jgi:nicotinamidase-related amidase